MIYLDYSATTPVLPEVIDSLNKATKDFIGNTNSLHSLGSKAHDLLYSATKQIVDILEIKDKELVYTSGATESNNLALKGIAMAYQNRGKHIIISKLEHPSIYAITDYLENIGFEISRVSNDEDGLINLEELKTLIRKDTILVSIGAVNSELGIYQPLKTIKQIIKKQNDNTFFHSDMTQAMGKVKISLKDVDLASASAHKFYGPKGIGFLYKKEGINLVPVIHGSSKLSEIRGGTMPLPLIVGMSKALRLIMESIEQNEAHVKRLNEKLVKELSNYDILINQTKYSIPHILNITILGIRPETFIHALENYDIYVGTNTACASGDISESVMALYNDKKRALSTIRVSLSYLTTNNEINSFLDAFKDVYASLEEIK